MKLYETRIGDRITRTFKGDASPTTATVIKIERDTTWDHLKVARGLAFPEPRYAVHFDNNRTVYALRKDEEIPGCAPTPPTAHDPYIDVIAGEEMDRIDAALPA